VRRVAIIQARMGSTRLPGKVLMDLGGKTVIERVIRRVGRAALVDEVVIATTENPKDDTLARECERFDVAVIRGSEFDVLDRYYHAAKASAAEWIVRITSDCPVIDPGIIDRTIQACLDQDADYASNVSPRTYPRGLDTEVFRMEALRRAWSEARAAFDREHVTPYFRANPEIFRITSITHDCDCSHHRWTVDTDDDLLLLRSLYARMVNRDDFGWRELLLLLEQEPELAELNAHVVQKC
jgi:spore coat polysaccharide biosynthesis protein SpsF (cytidylyltransferase family)